MTPPNRPLRPVVCRSLRKIRVGTACIVGSIGVLAAQPAPFAIDFLPTATNSLAVTAPDSTFVVSVYSDSAPLTKAHTNSGGKQSALVFSGQDTTTHLCFFKNPYSTDGRKTVWAENFGQNPPQKLQAITLNGSISCNYTKWVTQLGDKVLPLGLLSITFNSEVAPSGSPLVDENGRIVGLIIQKVSANTAYAIPAQAVRRVQHDIATHRKLVRGWLGISLSTESTVPRITRVWPNSPALEAGLSEGDILISASGYPTARYPDAVNALFYAIPGQPTPIQVSRNNQRISRKIIPIQQKPGG